MCEPRVSTDGEFLAERSFRRFVSGLEIPFPGNRDRRRQRRGSNAAYRAGRPSIWRPSIDPVLMIGIHPETAHPIAETLALIIDHVAKHASILIALLDARHDSPLLLI